jgi:hypothetical protein
MTDYDNTNRGVLFANNKKTSDRSPSSTGGADIKCPGCDGVHNFRLSAWTNVIKQGARAGQKMLSLSFEAQEPAPILPTDSIDTDQDIPF